MKVKYLDETYLRDVTKYAIKTFENEEEYVVFKHIIEVKKKYIETHTRRNRCLQDNGYFMIEYLPKYKNYIVRAFLDDKKEVLRYYIDIVGNVGIEKDSGRLYYEDLYLDVVDDFLETGERIHLRDFTDLVQAQMDGKITKEQENKICLEVLKLIDEINNNSNKYMNINHKELVESILKTKNFDKVVVRDKVSKNNKNSQSKDDNARKEDESALCI